MKSKKPLLLALLPALLVGCTGTEDESSTIRYVALGGAGDSARLNAADLGATVSTQEASVPGAVGLEGYSSGQKLAVLYRDHLETRDASLGNASTALFPNPTGFTPCYVRLQTSVARDRLAAL